MGILSSSVSITRYHVDGKIEDPLLETIGEALKKDSISEIDDDSSDIAIGWTSFENPYQPAFESSSFAIGSHLIFSLRIDKKIIPSKIIQKHYTIEMAKRLSESGREFLSRNEKKQIKEHVIDILSMKIPSTPNIYDIVWNYEESTLCFLSTQKSANEELETLFSKSFKLTLIRLFPYTIADLTLNLSDTERDLLNNLSPTTFTE